MSYYETHETFYNYTASLLPLNETQDFYSFLHCFTTTTPTLITQVDLTLLEANTEVWHDLENHYEQARALKMWKRTHYTQGKKSGGIEISDLPDELKRVHRLLMVGEVGKGFPAFNGAPVSASGKWERERWRVVNLVLVGFRNVAFEMVGVESCAPMSAKSWMEKVEEKVDSPTGEKGSLFRDAFPSVFDTKSWV